MKIKNILSFVLGFVLLFSLFITSFAETNEIIGEEGWGASETLVSYGAGQTFVVVIPDEIDFDGGNMARATIFAGGKLRYNEQLFVQVSSPQFNEESGVWQLMTDSANEEDVVGYVIRRRDDLHLQNNDYVLVAQSLSPYEYEEEVLDFEIVWYSDYAGVYIDTLTFTVSVEDMGLMIDFFIFDSYYRAEKGMTWREWIESQHNTDNLDSSDITRIFHLGSNKMLDLDDAILDGEYYR